MMVAEWGEEGLREKLKYSTSLLAAASSCFVRHAWVLQRDIISRYTYYLQEPRAVSEICDSGQ